MGVLDYINFFFNINAADILSSSNWFLIIGVLFWVLIAVIQDFKKREVANWWNFSLIAFILVYRAFVAIYFWDYWYFLWGVIGLGTGFILANLFYYARMFAGGDAKLLMALGAFLPLGTTFIKNLQILLLFILLFIFLGGIYGLIYSLIAMVFNFKKFRISFKKYFIKYKLYFLLILFLGFAFCFIFLIFKIYLLLVFSFLLLILPILLAGSKVIEEVCLIKLVSIRELTIGDWVTSPIKVGNKIIKPNWEGLSEEELEFINKKLSKSKKIKVRYGIPFTPAFLLALLFLIWFIYKI